MNLQFEAIEEDGDDDFLVLSEDIRAAEAQEIRGISSNQRDGYNSDLKTAENHFEKFLITMHTFNSSKYPAHYSAAEFSDSLFISDVLDRFATYLIDVAALKKCNSALGYLSKIKTKIMKDHKTEQLFGDGKWYRDIRTKVKQKYLSMCHKNGTALVDHAPPMTETDQLIMGKLLVARNTRESDQDRGILILQKQTIGRVSETSRLKYTNIKMCKLSNRIRKVSCFVFTITRLNTGLQHSINIFLHAYSWVLCPVHAIATIIATCNNPSVEIFPNIPEGSEASYVNRLLEDLFQSWQSSIGSEGAQQLTKELTSHSGRSGGAQDASDHKDVQIQWIIPRGIFLIIITT
jgi:hypothetical protein